MRDAPPDGLHMNSHQLSSKGRAPPYQIQIPLMLRNLIASKLCRMNLRYWGWVALGKLGHDSESNTMFMGNQAKVLCSLCHERWKDSFIKKCGHIFCQGMSHLITRQPRWLSQIVWNRSIQLEIANVHNVVSLKNGLTSNAVLWP